MDPSGKMLFTCASCGYRARIPERYANKEVHCPRCQVVQVANTAPGGNALGSGQTLTFQNLKAAFVEEKGAMHAVEREETVRFACTACKYSANLAAKHAGSTIRCPGCGASQPVAAMAGAPSAGDTGAHVRPGPEERILFTCDACEYRARIPSRYAGRSVLCPGCGKAVSASAATAAEKVIAANPIPTGNTAVLTKVSTTGADGEPSTGAMTRVGMQFVCKTCGYQSRISPSCAGGVIYCPACRAEQRVDMGGGTTSAPSDALEPKSEEAPEPTITPARGNRQISSGSHPIPVVEPRPATARTAPTAKRSASSASLPVVDESGRTASGRFPASVAPFSAEPPPLQEAGAPAARPPIVNDRRNAKTAPLPVVTATPPTIAGGDTDDDAMVAEARDLARRSPSNAAMAVTPMHPPAAVTKPKLQRAANAAIASAASAAASPTAARGEAPLPPPRRRALWATVALLMMTVTALVVASYQWNVERTGLIVEKAEHGTTRQTLKKEQAEHRATRESLAAEKAEHEKTSQALAAETATRKQVEQNLDETKSALIATATRLNEAEQRLTERGKQIDALNMSLEEQTLARQKAEQDLQELEGRWKDAEKGLGNLLKPYAAPPKVAAPAPPPAAAVTPPTGQPPLPTKLDSNHEF